MSVVAIEHVGEHAGQEVTIRGWLYNLRESGKLLFPIFRDGTGILQGVVSQKEQPEAFAALRGKAPWRVKHFLDKAYDLTVLRQSGAAYQFRHIELQRRLASRYESRQKKRVAADAAAGAPAPETSSTPAGQVRNAP